MASISEVTAMIRYGLNQMSSKNGHNEFEHLCRNVAKLRICENILPATGPVSSGGDQSRDFETYTSYIESSSIFESRFVAMKRRGFI